MGRSKVYSVIVYREKPYTRIVDVIHSTASSVQELKKVHLPKLYERKKGDKLLVLPPSQAKALKEML